MSPHFNVSEFRCKCGKEHDTLISDELIANLERLFEALGCSKIIVTSGYRCEQHDKNVGGSGTGQRTLDKAADICCYGQDDSRSVLRWSAARRRISVSLALPILRQRISTLMWMFVRAMLMQR